MGRGGARPATPTFGGARRVDPYSDTILLGVVSFGGAVAAVELRLRLELADADAAADERPAGGRRRDRRRHLLEARARASSSGRSPVVTGRVGSAPPWSNTLTVVRSPWAQAACSGEIVTSPPDVFPTPPRSGRRACSSNSMHLVRPQPAAVVIALA